MPIEHCKPNWPHVEFPGNVENKMMSKCKSIIVELPDCPFLCILVTTFFVGVKIIRTSSIFAIQNFILNLLWLTFSGGKTFELPCIKAATS